MPAISTSVEIPASPEKIWETISNPGTYEQWMTVHSKWKSELPQTFSKGATATEVVSMMGMPNTITWTVEEYEPQSRLKISGIGMAGVKISFDFSVEPNGGGASNVTAASEFEGQVIAGALGKAIEKEGLKNLEESLAKLSSLLA